MIARLLAVGFIFVCTSITWLVLAGVTPGCTAVTFGSRG